MFVLRLFTSLRTVTHSGLTGGLATEHTLGGRACSFFRDLTATQSYRARTGPSPILQRGTDALETRGCQEQLGLERDREQ